MQDRPDVQELLGAVREFLQDEALPRLEGRAQLHARVAANVIALVQRELALAPASDTTERARLEALLGRRGELAELNAELARRIRGRELAADDAQLLGHLWSTALEKLAVDNPGYSGYRRALEALAPGQGVGQGPTPRSEPKASEGQGRTGE
jgi:hypothetical protein